MSTLFQVVELDELSSVVPLVVPRHAVVLLHGRKFPCRRKRRVGFAFCRQARENFGENAKRVGKGLGNGSELREHWKESVVLGDDELN